MLFTGIVKYKPPAAVPFVVIEIETVTNAFFPEIENVPLAEAVVRLPEPADNTGV